MFESNKVRMPCNNTDEKNPHSDSSFLYIRYKDDLVNPDVGDRPSGGLPPGTVYYYSPDISFSPTDALGNVKEGTAVTVKARIFNDGGIDAFNVYVEFWWFNPTLAFTVAPLTQRIGTKIVNVPGRGSYVDVECPNKWTPTFVNGGHECLVVQFSSPSEGADDLKFPFTVTLDRHVGQYNLTVTDNQPGQKLQLVVGNPFRSAELFTVRLSSLLVSGNMDELQTRDVREVMSLLGSAVAGRRPTDFSDQRPMLDVTDVTQREFGVCLTRTRKTKPHHDGQHGDDIARYLNARARSDPDFNPETLGRSLVEFVLHSNEARVLDFDLPPVDVGSGNFLVHHISQVVAGCDVGGYTVVVPPVDFRGKRKTRTI
jgi:hypothetical protein